MPAAEFRDLLPEGVGSYSGPTPKTVMTIRSLTTRVYELFSTLAVNNRIQAELLRLASFTCQGGNSARIAPAPTHVEIASRVSSHREAVTRELNRLFRGSASSTRHGVARFWLRDLDELDAKWFKTQPASKGSLAPAITTSTSSPNRKKKPLILVYYNVPNGGNCHSTKASDALGSPRAQDGLEQIQRSSPCFRSLAC